MEIADNTIATANAVIYEVQNNELRFLLVQEKDGLWSLCGGKAEPEDADLVATMKRELREELGLQEGNYALQETGVMREFEYTHPQSDRFGKKGVVHFFSVLFGNPASIKASDEVLGAAWHTENEAMEKLMFEHMQNGFREVVGRIRSRQV